MTVQFDEETGLPFELIDTLWNVNVYVSCEKEPEQIGINRYIMECKFFFHFISLSMFHVN